MTFFVGILISVGGFLIIVFRERLQNIIGNVGFAEQYLGPGGTFTFLLLLGIIVFLLGLMWATGTLQAWFFINLGRFFGHS